MKSQIHDGQRDSQARTCISQIWKVIGLTVCFVCASAGFALAVTGNLEPPPGEATNLNTGEPRSTTPTQPSWANRLQGIIGEVHRWKLVMGGEAVLDRETGLVWEQSPTIPASQGSDNTLSWYEARSYCAILTKGGRGGWLLPSLNQLSSLVDPGNTGGNPDLPSGHPFSNVEASLYWTATTAAQGIGGLAWVVDFQTFGATTEGGKPQKLNVWCVRSGQTPGDAY